ncbi:MAG: hypothetical protein AAF490_32030 [Chloroflexota bacterium]
MKLFIPLALISILLIGCGNPDPGVLPTSASALDRPADSTPVPGQPSSTPLPATTDLTAVYLADNPTAVPTTPAPTRTATPVNAVLNIIDPAENETVVMGQTYIVNGLVEREEDQTVWVSLISSNGRLLVEQQAEFNDFGWRVDMVIPKFVSGAAEMVAVLRNPDGVIVSSYRQKFTLFPDTVNEQQYLILTNPEPEDTGVSGFNIFFDGQIKRPTNNRVTITLYGEENCQTRIARQSFTLGASVNEFYWSGFAIPSHSYAGPACAVASFGNPGAEDWREAQVPMTIFATDDENASGIHIANPRVDNLEFFAGQEIVVFGTAANISQREVFLSLLLENGRIVEQKPILTNFWGYFETVITLPLDVIGFAQIIVETGDDDIFADDIRLINILEAPTPTPGPPPTVTPFPTPTPES